jgi:hypothetical protein
LKKHIAFILFSFYIVFYPFFGYSQLTIDKKNDGISVLDQQKIAHLYELIISDVYQAEKEIDKFKKKN